MTTRARNGIESVLLSVPLAVAVCGLVWFALQSGNGAYQGERVLSDVELASVIGGECFWQSYACPDGYSEGDTPTGSCVWKDSGIETCQGCDPITRVWGVYEVCEGTSYCDDCDPDDCPGQPEDCSYSTWVSGEKCGYYDPETCRSQTCTYTKQK